MTLFIWYLPCGEYRTVFISWVQVVRHSEMTFTLSCCGLRTEGDSRWQGEDSLTVASEGIC